MEKILFYHYNKNNGTITITYTDKEKTIREIYILYTTTSNKKL